MFCNTVFTMTFFTRLRLTVTALQKCRWGSFGDSLAVISEPGLFYSIQAIPLLPTNATNAAMPPKKRLFAIAIRTSHESINRFQPLVRCPPKTLKPHWVSVHFVPIVARGCGRCSSQPSP